MPRLSWRHLLAPAEEYRLTAGLFLRLLALIYLAAFLSLWPQIDGLAGPQGILPLAERLDWLRQRHGALAWLHFPTLFWLTQSGAALRATALAGAALSLAMALLPPSRLAFALLFAAYLSLVHAGGLFMNFQWDYLLLESGFLAVFLVGGPPRVIVWLLRWLLFRLRFLSGVSKLLSGDPSWSLASLTAVYHYFEVQPLPHGGGWYAHLLPLWMHKLGAAGTLFIEIVVPFLMFATRRARFLAAWLTILLQVLIIATSNHNWINLLTIVLCLFLFDDRALGRVLPARAGVLAVTPARPRLTRPLALAAALLVAPLTVGYLWLFFAGRPAALPAPVQATLRAVQPWHVVHNYHVFPTMKTERIEVLVEGSRDGRDWRPYRFRYKPDDPAKPLRFIVPHQPRLDWMMWFVPMGHPVNQRWFAAFLDRLLHNAPPVTALLADNPFADAPPRYLRLTAWRYRFTTPRERAAGGHWWRRERLGLFPPGYWPP